MPPGGPTCRSHRVRSSVSTEVFEGHQHSVFSRLLLPVCVKSSEKSPDSSTLKADFAKRGTWMNPHTEATKWKVFGDARKTILAPT